MKTVYARTDKSLGELEQVLEKNGFERVIEIKYSSNDTGSLGLDITPTWEVYTRDCNGFFETAFISDYDELVVHRDYSKQTRSSPQSKLENFLDRYYDDISNQPKISNSIRSGAFLGGLGALGMMIGYVYQESYSFASTLIVPLITTCLSIPVFYLLKPLSDKSKSEEYAKHKFIIGSRALDYLSGKSGEYFKKSY